MRSLVLLLAVVLPGITATSLSTYFLLPEWAVLEASYKNYQQLANPSTMRDLFIAPAAKNRHPINCFTKEVRVLLGGAITAIGIHGICTQTKRTS